MEAQVRSPNGHMSNPNVPSVPPSGGAAAAAAAQRPRAVQTISRHWFPHHWVHIQCPEKGTEIAKGLTIRRGRQGGALSTLRGRDVIAYCASVRIEATRKLLASRVRNEHDLERIVG